MLFAIICGAALFGAAIIGAIIGVTVIALCQAGAKQIPTPPKREWMD